MKIFAKINSMNFCQLAKTKPRMAQTLPKITKQSTPSEIANINSSSNSLSTSSPTVSKKKYAESLMKELKPITPGQFLRETKILSRAETRDMLMANQIKTGGIDPLPSSPLKSLSSLYLKSSTQMNTDTLLTHSKLYVFYKPKGFLSTMTDPEKRNRPTMFEYLKHTLSIDKKLYPIGRLDFNAEGIILLTDNEDAAKAWIENENHYDYVYEMKLTGRVDEKKLNEIRKGKVIKGVKCGPYFFEVKKQLKKSVKVLMKNQHADMRDIKLMLQKADLQMMKVKRISVGPYKTEGAEPGGFREVEFSTKQKQQYFFYKKKLLREKIDELEGALEKVKQIRNPQHDFKGLNNREDIDVDELSSKQDIPWKKIESKTTTKASQSGK